MSIFVLALTFVLVAAPLWTSHLFRSVYSWERRQVAVDNAAIILGRSDRKSFTDLSRLNRTIEAMEVEHHLLHACARSNTPAAPECALADAQLERVMENLHRVGGEMARAQWRLGQVRASAETRQFGVTMDVPDRPAEIPIGERKCAACALSLYWERSESRRALHYAVRARGDDSPPVTTGVELTGRSLRDGRDWEYRLEPQ